MDYIIYTTEGFTETPNGNEIENCQILAFEKATNLEDAKNTFFNKNPHLFKQGFSKEKIVIHQIIQEL